MDRRNDLETTSDLRASADLIPDLLHPVPMARLDRARIERALDFAFASGGAASPLDDCLAFAKNAPSTWDPASFERDVFLTELTKRVFPIVIGGTTFVPDQTHLRALFAHPPADPEIARYRQAVLRELSDDSSDTASDRPTHRSQLESLYVQMVELKRLLGEPEMGEEPQINRRRVDALVAARDLVHTMANGFEGARSALSRLREYGERVRGAPAFTNLLSLLDFEGNLAGVDVRLRIGHDGSMRSFDIVKLEENRANPFYRSPMRRFWQRVSRLFRGYKLREDEILEELIDGVFEPLRGELGKLFQLFGDLEFYLAALGFSDMAKARGLAVCLPELALRPSERSRNGKQPAPESRHVEGLFNPLLLSEGAVPCSLSFARHDSIVILTGPNSGGKTRLLQTLAMTQMLGQTGMFVPASKARLVWVDGLFVSLIEDAKADQREGRLGMELMRIREVFERLRPGGLVMLDELCAGTNPSEGEEIFRLVVALLAELEPQAFITTHFLDFAARLENARSGDAADSETRAMLDFLQVELDGHDEPTYQFIAGVAKSSLAGKTAARLGVTRDELSELVERSRRAAGLPAKLRANESNDVGDASDRALPGDSDPPSEDEPLGATQSRSMHGDGNAEPADGRRPIGA